MAKIETFEELKCWQSARELTRETYRLCSTDPLASDYRLSSQLTSAAVSSMTNIAEGFARYHRGDFVRFLDIAQSSAAEVKSLLYVVGDLQYASPERVKALQNLCDKTQGLTLGLLRHVKRRQQATNQTRESPPAYQVSESTSPLSLPDAHTVPPMN